MTTTEQRPHHPFSPSTLQFLEACPHYQSRSEANERAIAGTIAHAVIESRQDDARLSDEDAEAVADCADFFERRKASMVGPITELKEVYLPIDDCEFEDGTKATTAGYVDCVLISGDKTYAEMMDWKFGQWHVTKAVENLQGIAYALGLFHKYPTIEKIKFWFKMPHLDYISEAEFTRDNIPDLYLRIQVVVARARDARSRNDFSLAAPSTPTCNFCSRIGNCDKVSGFACKIGNKFHPLQIPDSITPTTLHTDRDTTLGMRLASVMAVWSEAFRRQVSDRVLRGDADIPCGFKLESRTKRDLADAKKFKETSLKYVTEPEYSELQDPPGFGKLEDLISDKAIRGQKKAAIQRFKAELEASGAVTKSQPYVFLKAVSTED